MSRHRRVGPTDSAWRNTLYKCPYIRPSEADSCCGFQFGCPNVARFAPTSPLYSVRPYSPSAATAPHCTRRRSVACADVCQTSCPLPGVPSRGGARTGVSRLRDSYSPSVRLGHETRPVRRQSGETASPAYPTTERHSQTADSPLERRRVCPGTVQRLCRCRSPRRRATASGSLRFSERSGCSLQKLRPGSEIFSL